MRSNVALDFATATPTVMFAVLDAPSAAGTAEYQIPLVNGAVTMVKSISVAVAVAFMLF